jgi:selenocysteine lyase/cysteine desulfurase
MNSLVNPQDFPARNKSTYLNAASVALMYRKASESVIAWQEDLAENGTINFDEVAEEAVFDNLHNAAAKLVNVNPEDIAVGTSVTELMSSLAWAIAPGSGTNVISTNIVFPSTIYPWARVARHTGAEIRYAQGRDGYVDPQELIDLIDENTSVVSISHVEFGTGQQYDLNPLAEEVHSVGGFLIVDATQSAGMLPIDVAASGADALITAAYKWLCGPFGVAFMYLAPHLYKQLDPGTIGWRSHQDMWNFQADQLVLPDSARRFEFSTMTYGCAIGLTESIEYLLSVGIETIFTHTRSLADSLRKGLASRGIEIVSPAHDDERTAILAVRFPKTNSAEAASFLNSNNVVVSKRGEFVRFSPHLYNESGDIEKTLEIIDTML